MFSGSEINLSKSALKNNLGVIRQLLEKDTRLSSVIKGNAYGHGIGEMTTMLQEEGVDHFSVFNAEEAYEVYKFLRDGDDLMIMGDVDGDALDWAVEHGVDFFVFDLHRLNHAVQQAEKTGRKARVHLEVETGMNRTGLSSKDFRLAVQQLKHNERLVNFMGVCTHFAGAESITNYHRIQGQIRKFKTAYQVCQKADCLPRFRHACCSAGILRYPRMNMDLVRVGILQYGHWPSTETRIEFFTKHKHVADPLQRILTWKSRVMSIKQVKTGQFIGYGTSYQTACDMRIAVVPVGYGYGYSRRLSNQGFVLIEGKRAPVIGTINMNALSVDISEIPEVQAGAEAILIGKSNGEEITVSSFGEMSRQLNYELLTRLPASIPRHIVN